MNIQKIVDSEFDTVDLSSYECDICLQDTGEKLVECLLNDEYARSFDGSRFAREPGSLTHAHQLCLDRWADIIERNSVVRKKAIEKKQQWKSCTSSDNGSWLLGEEANESRRLAEERLLSQQRAKVNPKVDREKLMQMSNNEIAKILLQLKEQITGMSTRLIHELQERDNLQSNITTQKKTIGDIIRAERITMDKKSNASTGTPIHVALHPLST